MHNSKHAQSAAKLSQLICSTRSMANQEVGAGLAIMNHSKDGTASNLIHTKKKSESHQKYGEIKTLMQSLSKGK